ncbi:MAG TPA: nucleotide disphospho-sugar-binding domain-containing protein [Pseudonocardiaceae bacterium]|nr:nucleotide disphospho-sugar-binding domain-containing protein [Pseudonocardiaceae bacterium]
MTRFLIVVPPLVGHINPTVGVAACLRAEGHEVAFAGAGAVVHPLVGDAYRIYDCAVGLHPDRPADARGPAALRFLWESFLVPLAEAMVPGVHAAVADFEPDVLLVDQQALAGALVADRLGLPWATSATTSAELVDPLAGLPKVDAWVRGQLSDLAERYGDQGVGGDLRFSRFLVLAFTTRALVGSEDLGSAVRFVGPSIADRPGKDLDWPWDDTRPAVLVTLGTANVDAGERFLTACAEAVAGRPINAVVLDPAGVLGPQPRNVLVADRVRQLSVLPRVDAVVCHGGHNTVCEALWHGVPLVVAPIRDDQPIVADQVVAAGAGIRLRFTRAGAEQIGAAIDSVLGDASLRNAARAVGESFRQAGGASAAAQALVQLTVERTLA